MEAIAALGLAANVEQFVEFACDLFNSICEIRVSDSGASKEASDLGFGYSRLQNCSRGLSSQHEVSRAPTELDDSLTSLAAKCDETFRELLGVVERLKREAGSKHRR